MQKSIARTSPRELEGAAFIDNQRERPGRPGFFPEVLEANDQQLERVLSYPGQKPTELERYVYLIGLCNRNERLFHKVLMSQPIAFLLAADCRRTNGSEPNAKQKRRTVPFTTQKPERAKLA
jgi:hypothetical protein